MITIIELKKNNILSINIIPGRLPYEGWIENKYIGILYYEPSLKKLWPESIKFLSSNGIDDYTLQFIN